MSSWIALLLAIAANIGANIAFKHFVQTTEFRASWSSVLLAALQPSLWIGGLLGVSLLGLYLYAIRELPLGLAYTAATSLSIAGVTLAGVLIYGETINPRALIGIGVVMAGMILIATA